MKAGSEFISMEFSSDGKFLIALTGGPNWSLLHFPWEKGKCTASISIQCESVYQVSISPFDNSEIFVSGTGMGTLYKLADGVLRPITIEVPKNLVYFI